MKASHAVLLTILLASQFFILPAAIASQSPFTQIPVPTVRAQNGANEFGTNIRVTDGTSPYSDQVEPTMAITSDGRILVGWKEAESHSGPGRRVGFAYSLDGGITYTPNILMTRMDDNNFQSDPWLEADANDNVYFVWIEFNDIVNNYDPEGLGVAKTTDGGETWGTPVNAADTTYFDDKETACIDSDGNIYIVWDHIEIDSDYIEQSWDLRFTKSTDGGATFTPTTTPAEPWIPYIHCTSNDSLYMTYVNGTSDTAPLSQIFFTRSDDQGDTWTPPILVNPSYISLNLLTVVRSDSSQNVYVAYSAGLDTSPQYHEIYVIKSTDGGQTWDTPVQVNDDNTGMQRMVEMYITADDTIHMAWLDARLGEWNIYYSYSLDGGATFSEDERISDVGFPLTFTRPGDYFCLRPAPNGDMCIVWTDGRNGINHDIYFARQGLVLAPVMPFPVEWLLVIVAVAVVVVVIVIVVWLMLRRKGE